MSTRKQIDSVILLSGGIDSTTVLAQAVAFGRSPFCLIFDYGQTLAKEVQVAMKNADRFGLPFQVVSMPMEWISPGCALLGDGSQIPHGRTRAEISAGGTPATYVPFRNGIMLAIAGAFGEAHGLEEIYCGGNGLDSGNYWDDTQEFAEAMEKAIDRGTSPKYKPRVLFPNATRTKADVVRVGLALGVDYSTTWSCYRNGDHHCGTCDSCVQRSNALAAYGLSLEGTKP